MNAQTRFNVTAQSIGFYWLPVRFVRSLGLVAALGATSAVVAVLFHVNPASVVQAAAQAPLPSDAAIMLPTVVVRPEPEIPTLAAITVRSGDSLPGRRADEEATDPPVRLRVKRAHADVMRAVTSFATEGSAGSGFGIPYYSFGKPLRRADGE